MRSVLRSRMDLIHHNDKRMNTLVAYIHCGNKPTVKVSLTLNINYHSFARTYEPISIIGEADRCFVLA